jgi:hypothetical protein
MGRVFVRGFFVKGALTEKFGKRLSVIGAELRQSFA